MGKLDKGMYERMLMPISQRTKVGRAIPSSPLLTNFESWSDKKTKLFFHDFEEYRELKLSDFNLQQNCVAKLLASPMRSERNSRSRVPKDLLIQLKPSQRVAGNGKYDLKPSVKHYRTSVSSYVCNNKTLLQLKSCDPSLWKTTQHLNTPNDIEVTRDKEAYLAEYGSDLRRHIQDEFSKKNMERFIQRKPTKNDVKIYLGELSTKMFTLIPVSKRTSVLGINISSKTDYFPVEVVQYIEKMGPLVLRSSKDSDLISLLYKLVNYFK
ncbi:hypothetical protein RNJ44_03875 [Nakaseomyces bracarensis]|uniref:Required for respiratory growth protein 8, mitochondrial n=1 Tax=Nakaseomyces bracarensis TaxID=273131 RepID=A0ABR4NY58_9SACH